VLPHVGLSAYLLYTRMIGKTISHYKILEKLGEGGMGVVYKAQDTKLGRLVALKFLTSEFTRDEEARSRFIREAQAASALDHPNIAVVHEIGETSDGQFFICMAYYQGKTLKQRIEDEPLSIEEAIRLGTQIADGLGRAHEAGIIHRDIKPANVIVTDRGEAKIVDFGLAKLTGQTAITRQGRTAGTAAYMSPEQALGDNVDQRSDLFSLGTVLYEMVTGQRPFRAEHEAALLYSIVNVSPQPPSSVKSEIPKGLDYAILKLLEKNPEQRYQTAADLRSDLENYRGLPQIEKVPKVLPRKLFRVPLLPSALIILTLVILSLLLIPEQRVILTRWIGIETVPTARHIAVLPFRNIGSDSSNQVLCDGLVETLTSKLTQIHPTKGSFWVVASSEVKERKVMSAAEARNQFGVTLVVTGTAQRQDGLIKLTMNLVDAQSSRQLKSQMFEVPQAKTAGMEGVLLKGLAEMLGIPLEPQVLQTLVSGGTRISGAYDFYLQGRGYLQRFERIENINLAIGMFENAIGEDSLYALAYAGLGEAYWRKYEATRDLQSTDEAIRNCRRALALNDQLLPARVTLGITLVGRGKYEDGVQEFKNALEIDPLYYDVYRELAKAYESLGDLKRAESTYKKAIELSPTYWANHNNLGKFYYMKGRYEEAARKFEDVVALTPDNTRGWNNLGASYFKLKRWPEARRAFERSVQIEPSYVVYSNIATLLFYEGRYADAAHAYEKALSLQSTDFEVWGNLASAYFWSNNRQRALETYKKAAQMAEEQRALNPRDASLWCKLAGYYSMVNKPQDARALLKEALTVAPKDGRVLGRSAMVYEQLGDRGLALQWLEKAFRQGFSPGELEYDPEMAALRADSRYQDLAQRYSK
jgi:serine/threonine protein kinase/tetratricopeptide (TPR) repeat protein